MTQQNTEEPREEPAYWSIKLYENNQERETIRGLNRTKKGTLMRVFDRLGVRAIARGYNSDGSSVIESEVVNSHASELAQD